MDGLGEGGGFGPRPSAGGTGDVSSVSPGDGIDVAPTTGAVVVAAKLATPLKLGSISPDQLAELEILATYAVLNTRRVDTQAPFFGGGPLDADLLIGMNPATPSVSGYMTASQAAKLESLTPYVPGVTPSLTTVYPVQGGGSLATSLSISVADATPSSTGLFTAAQAGWLAGVPTNALAATRQVNTQAPFFGGGPLTADLLLGMNPATPSSSGYMTASQANKLEGLTPGTSVLASMTAVFPIQGGGSLATSLNVSIAAATPTNAGSIAAADQAKLNNIPDRYKRTVRYAMPGPMPTCTAVGTGIGKQLIVATNAALFADGSAVLNGDRLLIWNEPSMTHNGIYTQTQLGVSGSAQAILTRAIDFDEVQEVLSGVTIDVESGTAYGGQSLKLTTVGTITVDTTPMVFQRYGSIQEVNPCPYVYEDFRSGASSNGNVGDLGWGQGGTGIATAAVASAQGHTGVIEITCSNATTVAYVVLGTVGTSTFVYSDWQEFTWTVKPNSPTASARPNYRCGVVSSASVDPDSNSVNGVWLCCKLTDTNWFIEVNNAANRFRFNTGVAFVDAAWINVTIRKSDLGIYVILRTATGTTKFTIPTAAIGSAMPSPTASSQPFIHEQVPTSTSSKFQMDLFECLFGQLPRT